MKWWHYILLGAGAVGLCSLCYMAGRLHERTARPVAHDVVSVDTLYVRDTIRVESPKIVQRTRVDSVLVQVRDTVTVRDTLFVALERERIVAEGEDWRVVASGVQPSIDEVEVYPRTQIITRTERVRPSRWGISAFAGYGMTVGADPRGAPVVGVAVTYDIWQF